MSDLAGMKELSEHYAEEQGLSKTEARERIKDMFKSMTSIIVKKGGISIPGMFTIQKKTIKGREGTCALNGKPWKSEDKIALKIKVGNKLSEELNK